MKVDLPHRKYPPRPYQTLNDHLKRQRQDRILLIGFKALFVILGVVLVVLISRCILNLSTPIDSQGLINPKVKAEIYQKLSVRGLSQNTTVEITNAGYRFEFNGKFYKL